jgi:hypothetical protein
MLFELRVASNVSLLKEIKDNHLNKLNVGFNIISRFQVNFFEKIEQFIQVT